MSIFTYFVPNRQQVASITRANPGVVTTTQDHGYLTGLSVRFFFPLNFGMMQLDDRVCEITVLSSNSFSIDVDTTNFDSFSPLPTSQAPEVIPVGEDAFMLTMAVRNNQNIIPET